MLYVLFCSTGLLLAASSIAILRFQRRFLDAQAFWNSPTGAVLQESDSNGGSRQERQLERRLADLQQLVKELSQRDRSRALPDLIQRQPFDDAVRMARQGASIEDLTRCCGLNIGEARLIRRLHSPASEASRAA